MQRRQPNDMSRYAYHDAGRIARKMPTNAVAWAYSCTKAHDVPDWSEWTWPAGSIELICTKPETGLISAAADPRPPAYVIAH
jgi:hypothetical protein